jgi:hypothetical protein
MVQQLPPALSVVAGGKSSGRRRQPMLCYLHLPIGLPIAHPPPPAPAPRCIWKWGVFGVRHIFTFDVV